MRILRAVSVTRSPTTSNTESEVRRFKQPPPGYLVSHHCTMFDLHPGTAGLDHQVDPLVGDADGLPGLNPSCARASVRKPLVSIVIRMPTVDLEGLA